MSLYSRNITAAASKMLSQFPILAIIGARQTGKTTLAKMLSPDFLYMDLEQSHDYERITADTAFFFKQHPHHVIFDEAQLHPELFATLRGVIDTDRQHKGRFIITGSSSAELLENISESLAGRVAIIELGTLKANEFFQQPISDFYSLLKAPLNKDTFVINTEPLRFEQMQAMWFQGGYPEPITANDAEFYQEWMRNYQATYINRDIARLFPKLNKIAFRRFVSMLGELSSKVINKSDLGRSVNVSEPTIADYLDIAAGTFLWRTLPSFENNVTKRIVKMPRGHIRDAGLLHNLLHIQSLEQLQSSIRAGFSFEAFVIEEILKGLEDSRIKADAFYYRTYDGAEIDLILKGAFGTLPVEVKYGSSTTGRQLRTLTDFIKEHQLPLGMVVNQADSIEWLTPNIVQIPVGFL